MPLASIKEHFGSFQQQWILVGILVLVIVAAAQGVWVNYPISPPVRGLDWHSSDSSLFRRFAAAPFLLLALMALSFLLANKTRQGVLCLAASIAALLAVPEWALLVDSTWLQTYVEEGSQQDKFQYFIPFLGGIPSANYDPYLNSPDKFQYLPDRLRIIRAMMGWGWSVSLIGLFALMVVLRRIGKLPSLGQVVFLSLVGVMLIGVIGSNTLRADFSYRKGDQLLGLGDYKNALKAYSLAIARDPQLANSNLFLRNVSKAYYQSGGSNDPRGYLYLSGVSTAEGRENTKALLEQTVAENDGSLLGKALSRMAQRKIADIWLNESIRAYRNGGFGSAMLGLRRILLENNDWRHVHFFSARLLSKLHTFDESIAQYNALLLTVDNASIKAAIYSAMGDAHAGAGRVIEARNSYEMSSSLDKTGNIWAIKGLGGT